MSTCGVRFIHKGIEYGCERTVGHQGEHTVVHYLSDPLPLHSHPVNPIMPKFRLVFTDPSDSTAERVQQIFAHNYQDEPTEQWITKMLQQGGPDSWVTIYHAQELPIAYRRKPKAEVAK